MRNIKQKKFKVIILTIIITFTIIFCYWQNNDILITELSFSSEKVPSAYNDFVIVQISDLHNKSFGKNQSTLIKKVENSKPDIIVITGDLIDRNTKNPDNALILIDSLINIAPIYYVTGNHEATSKIYNELIFKLSEKGITLSDDKKILIEKENSKIEIIGLSDPTFKNNDYLLSDDADYIDNHLSKLVDVEDNLFKILLSHRPELIDIYAKYNIDIVFTGHAHGGQIRLPFIGGLYAPNQGILPKYTTGSYLKNNTTEIVSRGLGNSLFPFRIFNRPEIIVCKLKSI